MSKRDKNSIVYECFLKVNCFGCLSGKSYFDPFLALHEGHKSCAFLRVVLPPFE